MTSKKYAELLETRNFIQTKIKNASPKAGFVLGSGLSFFGGLVDVEHEFSFSELPHFSPPSVEGHPGKLLIGRLEGLPVAVLQGRLHAYEGHSFSEVVFPVRLFAMLGVQILTVTNAAGGLLPKMKPGDFMVIKDHINLTGSNPLVGPNIAQLGPRFVDLTDPYDKKLRALLKRSLTKEKARHHEGVYCGVLGPSFETAAEIRFMQKIGGGAVGMSTVAEVIAARHAGMRVAGVSCVTNLGTGLSKAKLSHDDVKHTAQKVEKIFAASLKDFTRNLSSEIR